MAWLDKRLGVCLGQSIPGPQGKINETVRIGD